VTLLTPDGQSFDVETTGNLDSALLCAMFNAPAVFLQHRDTGRFTSLSCARNGAVYRVHGTPLCDLASMAWGQGGAGSSNINDARMKTKAPPPSLHPQSSKPKKAITLKSAAAPCTSAPTGSASPNSAGWKTQSALQVVDAVMASSDELMKVICGWDQMRSSSQLKDSQAFIAALGRAGIANMHDLRMATQEQISQARLPIGLRNYLLKAAKTSTSHEAVESTIPSPMPMCAHFCSPDNPEWTARDGLIGAIGGRTTKNWTVDVDGKLKFYWVCDYHMMQPENLRYYELAQQCFEEIEYSFGGRIIFKNMTEVYHAIPPENWPSLKAQRDAWDFSIQGLAAHRKKAVDAEKMKAPKKPLSASATNKRKKSRLLKRLKRTHSLKEISEPGEKGENVFPAEEGLWHTFMVRLHNYHPYDSSFLGYGEAGMKLQDDLLRPDNFLYTQGRITLYTARMSGPMDENPRGLPAAVFLHEMGHALGLCHTFAHPMAKRICEKVEENDPKNWSSFNDPTRIDMGSVMMYKDEVLHFRDTVREWITAGNFPTEIGATPAFSKSDILFVLEEILCEKDTNFVPPDDTKFDCRRPGEAQVLTWEKLFEFEQRAFPEKFEQFLRKFEEDIQKERERLLQFDERIAAKQRQIEEESDEEWKEDFIDDLAEIKSLKKMCAKGIKKWEDYKTLPPDLPWLKDIQDILYPKK